MPSKSYATFRNLLRDVDKLISLHRTLSEGKKGRKDLGHLTRSSVIMLCATWETYVEDLLLESVLNITNQTADASMLPKAVQKTISKFVRNHNDELKPIEITGNGWKKVLQDLATEKMTLLNTPKSTIIDPLYRDFLGVAKFSLFWVSHGTSKVDDFIRVRNEIAHKGAGANYVRLQKLIGFYDLIVQTVIESDSNLAQELSTKVLPSSPLPWDLTY